jgi:hypothetical protein
MLRSVGLLLLLVVAVGCVKATTALEVNVKLSESVFANSQMVRLIVSASDGTAFPAEAEPITLRKGMTIRNTDIDGDGAIDVVIDFTPDAALYQNNRFRLTPRQLIKPLQVSLRVDVLDGFTNPIARLGGHDPAGERVDATIRPGQVTKVKDLEPACITDCSTSTVKHTSMDATTVTFMGDALGAMAAGNLTGAMPRRADLAVASAHDDHPMAQMTDPPVHNAGLVRVFFGGATLSASPDVTVLGAEAGGQLGAAVTIGDVDGDGTDDLVIGSPGASNTRGAVYVLYGASTWPTKIDLASPPPNLATVVGALPGDRLGEALATVDVDGDGHREVLAAAPGAATVYVLTAAVLPRGKKGDLKAAGSLSGGTGTELGRTIKTRDTTVLISAPLAQDADGNVAGAVYVVDGTTLGAAGLDVDMYPRIVGQGGGFGQEMTVVDLDGGKPSVAVASPEDGLGTVWLFRLDALAAGDNLTSDAKRTLRALAPASRLGAALGWLPQPLGEALVLGAPSTIPADGMTMGPGAVFIVRAPTLQSFPTMRLDADGKPAASAIAGDRNGDAFGALMLVDDFTQDGLPDLVVAAPQSNGKIIYLFKGPLL